MIGTLLGYILDGQFETRTLSSWLASGYAGNLLRPKNRSLIPLNTSNSLNYKLLTKLGNVTLTYVNSFRDDRGCRQGYYARGEETKRAYEESDGYQQVE